jgi:hypothetical protein
MANRATGHGYESSANYPTSALTFQNIGNVHVMRDSYTKLTQLVQSASVQDVDWLALVEGTRWLYNVRLVLNAAYRTALFVARDNGSVLVHCRSVILVCCVVVDRWVGGRSSMRWDCWDGVAGGLVLPQPCSKGRCIVWR